MKVDGAHGVQNAVPGNPQATVVLAPQPLQAVYTPTEGCSCAIPPDAPQSAKQVRMISIVVIGTHVLALVVLGFYNVYQWVASLCAIIAAATLLCCYQKNCYTCTPIMWIVAAIFDLLSVLLWLVWVNGWAWVCIFPAIALISIIPAIVFGFKACSGWVHPVTPGQAGGAPVVTVVPNQGYAPRATVAHHMPQNAAPPAYGGSNV